jgi:hypothetical protein
MQFNTFRRTIGFVIALIALYGAVGPAQADFTPTPTPTFVGQFQSFIADFPKWDTTHNDMPLVFLATTPEQQRPQALLMLMLLWMHDHPGTVSTSTTTTGGGTVASLPPSNNPPLGGSGGGGGPPGGGGHTAGGAPEPSSLALMGCGSLGLLAFRLVRSRVVRKS